MTSVYWLLFRYFSFQILSYRLSCSSCCLNYMPLICRCWSNASGSGLYEHSLAMRIGVIIGSYKEPFRDCPKELSYHRQSAITLQVDGIPMTSSFKPKHSKLCLYITTRRWQISVWSNNNIILLRSISNTVP